MDNKEKTKGSVGNVVNIRLITQGQRCIVLVVLILGIIKPMDKCNKKNYEKKKISGLNPYSPSTCRNIG